MTHHNPAACTCPEHGHWVQAGQLWRLVRDLDVALNGTGAARQASLVDLVAQAQDVARRNGVPAFTPLPALRDAIRTLQELGFEVPDDETDVSRVLYALARVASANWRERKTQLDELLAIGRQLLQQPAKGDSA